MNYVVMNDLKHAVALKLSTNKKYKKYSKIYAFTTENLKGYFKYIDFKNKNVLTVAASGDHTLNSILKGAKKVDTFDINKLCKYFNELKYASIKSLNYVEYLSYFMISSEKVFNYDTFLKIKENLSNNTYMFFEGLYRHFDYNGKILRTSEIFNNLYDVDKYKIRYNDYLYKKNYIKIKKKIKEIKFTCTSLIDINKYVDKKYDVILLSNISDYISGIFKDNYLEKYKEFIEKNVGKLLNKNGIVVLAYIYDYQKNDYGRTNIDKETIRNKIFNDRNYHTYIFDSAIGNQKKDAVIVYRKEE